MSDTYVMRDSRAVSAHHEAGHAVVAWALEIDIDHISMEASGDRLACVMPAYTLNQHHRLAAKEPAMLRLVLIVLMAGIAGDVLHMEHSNVSPDTYVEGDKGPGSDQEKGNRIISDLGPYHIMDDYVGLAMWLLKKEPNRTVFFELGSLLERKTYLTAKDLEPFKSRVTCFVLETIVMTQRLHEEARANEDREREKFLREFNA